MLLIVVIIGILGFAGYFIWHRQNVANKAHNEASTAQDLPLKSGTPIHPRTIGSKVVAGQTYLVIKEWGVKFKLPDSVKGTSYVMSDDSQSAELQLASLADTPCEKAGWLGHIYRSDTNPEEAVAEGAVPNFASTKFGAYYYVYTPPQNMCVQDGPYYSIVKAAFQMYGKDVVPTVFAE